MKDFTEKERKEIGSRIEKFVKEHDMSQSDIARLCGVDPRNFGLYFKGTIPKKKIVDVLVSIGADREWIFLKRAKPLIPEIEPPERKELEEYKKLAAEQSLEIRDLKREIRALKSRIQTYQLEGADRDIRTSP